MAGFQFIHTTALNSKNAQQNVAEAERRPHACPHVKEPKTPELIHGAMPSIALAEAREWARTAEHPSGRKWRKDAPIIAEGVASLPASQADRFDDFARETTEWLKARYSDRLRSVVVHRDEANPHIHFFVRPNKGDFGFGQCHEGYKESREARNQPGNKVRTAYQDAMRAFQDSFASVAEKFGLARFGPKRARISRAEWKAQQMLAEAKQLKQDTATEHAGALQERRSAEQMKLDASGELRDARRERRELERQREELSAEQQKRLAELRERETEIKAERERLKKALDALPPHQQAAAKARIDQILAEAKPASEAPVSGSGQQPSEALVTRPSLSNWRKS